MILEQILALAILQGLTEFLPISSSAHLILVPQMLGWQDQGLAFDVAVHVGTLVAVVVYFRHELIDMGKAWTGSLLGKGRSKDSDLAWAIIIGTIPIGIVGLLIHNMVEHAFRSPILIAWATILFGALLWWADRTGREERDEHSITWKDVAVISIAQVIALIPGTSRSGITITAGLLVGLTRSAAARFSFLLSIPVIALAGAYKTVELIGSSGGLEWSALLFGALVAGISAYACISLFLRLLDVVGLLPFVLYRFALGIVLLLVFAR